ncbi:PRA1 family protein 3 [Culicoides brevitarsis]|uniref:PRA1 family protein 3 n=1 Tax=Culicoides brevitarsis TaxID=469753 RepID=UPI00307C7721
MSSNSGSSMQLTPLRSLNDFALESARFQLPAFNDLEKWGNRVTKNLLYYQTNYFVLWAVVFTLIGLVHPGKIILGIVIAFGALYGLQKFCGAGAGDMQQNKYVVLGAIAFTSYIILYMMDAVLIVGLAIFLPISLTFIHASLRLRNIQNKITNTLEVVGIKHSPMGKFLEAMGVMPDTF